MLYELCVVVAGVMLANILWLAVLMIAITNDKVKEWILDLIDDTDDEEIEEEYEVKEG